MGVPQTEQMGTATLFIFGVAAFDLDKEEQVVLFFFWHVVCKSSVTHAFRLIPTTIRIAERVCQNQLV